MPQPVQDLVKQTNETSSANKNEISTQAADSLNPVELSSKTDTQS